MKKILYGLLALAVFGGGWYFLKHRGAAAADEEAGRPAAKVETTELKEQAIAQTIEVFGVVATAPSGERVTAAAYDGVVRKINVSVGATVAVGDVLVELDASPDVKLASDSARSVLALAERALAATQERYDLKLANSQDLLAAQQAAQDARLKAASYEARGVGGDGRVVATVAGVVSNLDIFAGALVPAGTPLVSVATGGQYEVRLGVEAADAALVAAGQPVTVESSNRAGAEKFSATVRSVGTALDPVSGAAEVRVPLAAGAPLLLGEHVRAQIVVKSKASALIVPRSAVLPDEDKRILFTVKNGKAVKHEVKTGLTTDDLVEVIGDGLRAGDSVVTLGNYELEDGMAVQLPAKDEKKAAAKSTEEKKP